MKRCRYCDRKIILSTSPDGTGQEIWYHPHTKSTACSAIDLINGLMMGESLVPNRATPKE